MIEAVCFDMDGVIFDTERAGRTVMQEAAACQHCSLNDDQWRALLGANMKTTKEALRVWYGDAMAPQRFVDDWCRLMLDMLHRTGMPFKQGAPDILHRLQALGVKLALCTSNAAEVVAEYLHLADLTDAFDQVVTGEMIHTGKPAPDIYLLGAEKLGVSPEACVGVEDSVSGVKAVRAAGMFSVMIPDLIPYSPALAPYVDLRLDSLEQLEDVVMKKKE